MKILSLFAAVVVACGLAGSAAAAVPTEVTNNAVTSMDAACEPGATTSCDSTDTAVSAAPAGTARSAAKVDEAPLPVPELETSLMLMLGLVALGVVSRRRVSDRFDR